MREVPRHKVVVDGPKRWIYYDEHVPMCLYRLWMKAGTTHRVHTPGESDTRYELEGDGINKLNTITVVPAPGYVRIHSPALPIPVEWPGTTDLVGGGIWFNAIFDYEAVKDSYWYCASSFADRETRERYPLVRVLASPDEPYVFTERTLVVVSMFGDHETKCFKGEPGDVLTVNRETILAVLENNDV